MTVVTKRYECQACGDKKILLDGELFNGQKFIDCPMCKAPQAAMWVQNIIGGRVEVAESKYWRSDAYDPERPSYKKDAIKRTKKQIEKLRSRGYI